MAVNVAKLGGIPLDMSHAIEWPLKSGVAPASLVIDTAIHVVEQLMEMAGEPVTLEIASSVKDGPTMEVEQLYVLEEAAGSTPDRRRVMVVDRRIWLRHTRISRSYNIRRSSGDLTLLGGAIESASLKDLELYAPYSLQEEETKWTAEAILEDVLTKLVEDDYEIRMDVPDVAIEDLELEDPGDSALRLVFAHVPGAGLFVDLTGKLIIFDTRGGDEKDALAGRTIHWPGSGSSDWPVLADRRGIRASKVRVFFGTRVEAKVICTENDTTLATVDEGLHAKNVLSLPDRSLLVSYSLGGEERKRGQMSWVPFGDATTYGALEAWAADGNNAIHPTADDLSQEIFRKHFCSGLSYVRHYYTNPFGATNRIWASRLQAGLGNWRSTWQFEPHWWGRIKVFRTTRLAIINPEFGRSQAPSPVFQNYLIRPTHLGVVKSEQLSGRLQHGSIVEVDLGNDPEVSPFFVMPRDFEAGVFALRPALDPFGEYGQLVPGTLVGGELPSLDPGLWNEAQAAFSTWTKIELQKNHVAHVILTIIPGSPNDERRLYQHEVGPEDLGDMLGREVGEAVAPPVDIRIMPSLITADFGWRDTWDGGPGWNGVKGVLENGNYAGIFGELLNEVHIQDVARAVAAAYYSGLLDRVETQGAEHELDPQAEPAGTLSDVVHKLYPDGKTTTRLIATKIHRPDSLWRWLPADTRRVIMRSLEPGANPGANPST